MPSPPKWNRLESDGLPEGMHTVLSDHWAHNHGEMLKQLLIQQDDVSMRLKHLMERLEFKVDNIDVELPTVAGMLKARKNSGLVDQGVTQIIKPDKGSHKASKPRTSVKSSEHTPHSAARHMFAELVELRRSRRDGKASVNPSCLGRVVTSKAFEGACIVLIVLNAVYMGYHTEQRVLHAKRHPGKGVDKSGAADILNVCEVFFFAGYALEFILKVLYWRFDFFRGEMAGWNIFDGVLLCLSLLDMMAVGGENVMTLRLAKLTNKMIKALRMVRVVQFFKELRVLLLALKKSLRTFLWTMVAMGLMMYVAAVIFVQGIAESLEKGDIATQEVEEYWGSLSAAMLTNYKAVTGGAPWGKAGDALKTAGNFYFYVWLAYIGLLMLSVLRLFTGILAQQAKAASDKDQEDTVELRLRALFQSIDTDGSGQITKTEFDNFVRQKSTTNAMRNLGLHAGDLIKLIHLIDRGDDDIISIDEFILGCRHARGAAKTLDIVAISQRIEDIVEYLGMPPDSLRSQLHEHHATIETMMGKPKTMTV